MDLLQRSKQALEFKEIKAAIEKSSHIVICAHTNPDGDALGSGLALGHILRKSYPEKKIDNLLADNGEIPRIYRFLPGSKNLIHPKDFSETPDLFITVDVSVSHRLNEAEAIMKAAKRVAIIDHHPCDEPFSELNCIRTSAAATGVLIAQFAKFINCDLDPDVANCLFCAICTDTGRFQYQNADAEAFRVTSKLVNAGADPSFVSLNVYQNFSLSYLHLEAAVMARISIFCGGKIAYSYATQADFERTGADLAECDGLIDVVRSVSGAELALFLKECKDGTVRGNLRSKSNVDISGVARIFGGGGHKAAAGFTFKGSIDDAVTKCLPLLKNLLCCSTPEEA